jgi:hypothetical protein
VVEKEEEEEERADLTLSLSLPLGRFRVLSAAAVVSPLAGHPERRS